MTDPGPARIEAAGVPVDRRARTRRFALRALALSGGLVLALALAFGLTFQVAFFKAALLAGLLGLLAFLRLIVASAATTPPFYPQAVTIDGATLRVRGRSFALADVAQGFREDPDLVHLAMRNGEVLVMRIPDATERDRVLRAAGASRPRSASSASRSPARPRGSPADRSSAASCSRSWARRSSSRSSRSATGSATSRTTSPGRRWGCSRS